MSESKKQEVAEGAATDAVANKAVERRRALLRRAACSVPVLLVTAPSIAAASAGFRAPTPRVSNGHPRPTATPIHRGSGTSVRANDLGPAREIAQAMNKFR